MSEQSQHQGRQVEASIEIAAPVERVWDAWADPEHIARWFVDRARNRAEAGGTVDWAWEGFGEFSQQVLVADVNERLVLQAFPGALLEMLLSSTRGRTTITVVNSGFSDASEMDEPMAGVGSGWQMALALLKEYIERHWGERRHAFFHVRPSPLSPPALQPWFTEAERLATWLTAQGSPAELGQSTDLTMHDGKRIRARTSARSAREVALVLNDGIVLELKTFAGSVMGPGPSMVGLRGTSWGDGDTSLQKWSAFAESALDRLTQVLPPQSANSPS